MKKIAVVTGTRAEYGYLKPLMIKIKKDRNLNLIPLITGMHLLSDYGNSYKLVKKDFPDSVKIEMRLKGDSLKDMANYFASGVNNFTDYLYQNKPDIIIVLGDRIEPLAATFAAMYLNIPIAHINGGDVSGGTIDESIRHAITKIAHIHLVHTQENANRIEKMGEEKNRIFVVGALTLDTILNKKLPSKEQIFIKYNLDPNKKTFLVIQHPITTLKDYGYSQLQELFSALETLNEQTIIIYPNCDAGSKNFIDLIYKYKNKKFLKILKNIPHEDYLALMKSSNLMIGNSSSGIIEAPSFKIPVINIGSRQSGRSRSENIIDTEPVKKKIIDSIEYAQNDKEFLKKIKSCKNKFGDGKSSEKIVKILNEINIDEKLIQKEITY
jgi:UDP-N-acetylglucosamine 2-epimerase (non-hydrolysing)/GDP/UDP-N,N'-diacetylbacillosamine 2-epimerase (hydrolysing)